MKSLIATGSALFILTVSSASFARGTPEEDLPIFYEDFDTITEQMVTERSEVAAMESKPAVKKVKPRYYKGQNVELIDHGFYEDFDTITYDLTH